MQSLFIHNAKKAWQGLLILTCYKPKMHIIYMANYSVLANDLNCFHCRFDTVDYTVQRAEAVGKIRSLSSSEIRITLVQKPFLHLLIHFPKDVSALAGHGVNPGQVETVSDYTCS